MSWRDRFESRVLPALTDFTLLADRKDTPFFWLVSERSAMRVTESEPNTASGHWLPHTLPPAVLGAVREICPGVPKIRDGVPVEDFEIKKSDVVTLFDAGRDAIPASDGRTWRRPSPHGRYC